MKLVIYIFFLLLMFLGTQSKGQLQIDRQVIGSSGWVGITTNLIVSSTTGETAIQTQNSTNFIFTQGFHQTFSGGDSIITFNIKNESCDGAENGSIAVTNVIGCPSPYIVNVISLSSGSTLSSEALAAGEYTADVEGSGGCKYTFNFFIGLDSDESCRLKFYTGITPNGDGRNDLWNIDNIELFPDNKVGIYTRWGEEVWFKTGYDNINVVWDGTGNNGELGNATYFYVVTIDNKTYKGWVELTR